MKNYILKSFLLLTLSVNVYAIKPIAEDGIYVGVGLAIQSADGLDSGVGLVLNGGLPFKDLNDGPGNLGVEAELTRSIVAPSVGSFDVDFMTLGGYGTYTYDLNDNFYANGRVGLVYYSVDSAYGNDGVELSVGIGAGYKINKSINLYSDYTVIDELSNLTFGIEFKLSGAE